MTVQYSSYPDTTPLTQHAARKITWFWVFLRVYKRFNRDAAHTTKCSSSVSPHSSPDLPAIPRQRCKVETKGRQEDFNIALRSHAICPFHEPADGRGGNTSLHYKQTPAYFKVTCKSRHLQGSSQHDSSRYCEISSFWIRNDCTALDRIMFVKPYKQCLVLTPRLIISHNQMILSVTFYVKANVA